MNRLGTRISKEKSRPRSTERGKGLKRESSDVVNEGTAHGGSVEQESEVEQFDEYRINPEFLQNNQAPHPPMEKPKKTVTVRKLKSTSKLSQSRPKQKVYIARPVGANEDEDEMTCLANYSNDFADQIKPHNILGSVTDFKKLAAKERQQELLSAKSVTQTEKKYQRVEEKISRYLTNPMLNESKALLNWDKQMNERQRQQQHLSKQLAVNTEMLLLNQSDDYRTTQEQRTIIDRAIPTKDCGKGYRVGSEFWKQFEEVGKEGQISITLGDTERGDVKPLEHIGCPSKVKREMGTNWYQTQRMKNVHKSWQKSSYLEEQQNYFKDVIDELNPHKPYIDGLEVVGHSVNGSDSVDYYVAEETTEEDITEKKLQDDRKEAEKIDPLADFEDVHPLPIFGPSLLINGRLATWEGPAINGCKDNALDIQILFNCDVNGLAHGCIDLTNNGTAALNFQWKKEEDYNPFGLKNGKKIQRFYFDICDGTILPGVTVNIPFIFKSPNAGIFTENWLLETHPVLFAGRSIMISLHGTTTREDEYESERAEVEEMFRMRQINTMMARLVEGVIAGIKTPVRPSTPLDKYLTEEEIFRKQNKNLEYDACAVTALKEIYAELNVEQEWDMSTDTLLKNIINLKDDSTEQRLKKLNDEIKVIGHCVNEPVEKNVRDQCYQVLCEAIDKFVNNSFELRKTYGMQEKDFIIKIVEGSAARRGKKSVIGDLQKPTRAETKSARKDTPTGRNKGASKEKNKPEAQAAAPKELLVPAIEEVKVSNPTVNENTNHPSYGRYMEKMYGQVYQCMFEMVDNLTAVLSESGNDDFV